MLEPKLPSGTRPLRPKLLATLDALPVDRLVLAAEIAMALGEKSPVNTTTRLGELMELGLVKRRGIGDRYEPYRWRRATEREAIPSIEPVAVEAHPVEVVTAAATNLDAIDLAIDWFLSTRHVTPRQRAVLDDMVRRGGETADIAKRLGISTNTANNHLKGLFRATATASRTDLLALFARDSLAWARSKS